MASAVPPSASAAATAPSGTAAQASRPIVYGSCAYWRGKSAEESKSHEWTVYIRAANPEEARLCPQRDRALAVSLVGGTLVHKTAKWR
eukprot:scaffold2600_cov103-Isochrysis_galbana.AAC.12